MANLTDYRAGVGAIVVNRQRKLLLAKRSDSTGGWQFPQGGLLSGESAEQALYRELYEELGLKPGKIMRLAETKEWLSYRFPPGITRRYVRNRSYIGQKQRWFLVKMLTSNRDIKLNVTDSPEFSAFRWVDYWQPLEEVVEFKYELYHQVLEQFAPFLLTRKETPV
ncbi:MAG: RNA pyrophosphohydrolase [Gammaproteobacteria bacterium]|nr:RNA pyrophosphohydrolase [Gammaproteobacteria bacterium]